VSTKTKELYRNPEEALILGVCAGIARFTGMPVNAVRLFWVGANLFFFPLFFIYFFLALVLKKDPSARNPKNSPHNAQAIREDIEDLQSHIEHLQQKVRRMETYVTSDEFSFQRKLWDLNE